MGILYRDDRIPEGDDQLQERVRKACAYFTGKLAQRLCPWLDAFSFETDSKALKKTLRQAADDLRKALTIKTACLTSCREGFSTPAYLAALAKARIDAESPGPVAEKGHDPGHGEGERAGEGPGLLAALRRWRSRKEAEEEREGVTRYRILTRAVLRQIADTLPDGPEALAAVKGIGKRTVERYGQEILGIVSEYCRTQGIDPAARDRPGQPLKAEADAQEGDTRLVSYRLYREGLRIEEIASRRSLKPTTIEGHLAHYIGTGKLAVTDLMSDEKIARIKGVLAETGADALGHAKQTLGDGYSHGEIKMVQAHLARQCLRRWPTWI